MSKRSRNDIGQYALLADEWERPDGAFAALHWLATARARLIPEPRTERPLLVDIGCGGGLMSVHADGYEHVGVDLSPSALQVAQRRGVSVLRGDATRLPLSSAVADVVVAGEIFEHVDDVAAVVSEAARILRPDGVVVFDTINDSRWARFSLVSIGERMPGGPPRDIHDPRLFVAPRRLAELFAHHGLTTTMSGLRPSVRDYSRFLVRRSGPVRMLPTRSLAGVYQGTATRSTP